MSTTTTAASCTIPPPPGCLIRLPGQCVYYSGDHIPGPSINAGDSLDILTNKIVSYIGTAGVGTGITSVGLSMPNGFTVASSPLTSAGTIAVSTTLNGILRGDGAGFTTLNLAPYFTLSSGTLSMNAASISNDGYLTAANFSTFNNKVGPLRAINTTFPLLGGGDLSANRTLSIASASSSQAGALTAADWTSFNAKLSNISGLIAQGTNIVVSGAGTTGDPYVISATTGGGGTMGGSGTTNYIAKFTGSTAVGNSIIYETASKIGIGTTTPESILHATGNTSAGSYITLESSTEAGLLIGTTFGAESGYAEIRRTSPTAVAADLPEDLLVKNYAHRIVLSTQYNAGGSGFENIKEAFVVKTNSDLQAANLAGTGTRMVTTSADGTLGSAAIPASISGLTNNYLTKATSATTVAPSVLYDNGTNIGLGTTSPLYALHVVRSGNSGTYIRVENTFAGVSASAGINVASNATDASFFATSLTSSVNGVVGPGVSALYSPGKIAIAVDGPNDFVVGTGINMPERFKISGTGVISISNLNDTTGVAKVVTSTNGVLGIQPQYNGVGANDLEVTDSTKGLILKSPDGTRWRVTVDNTGSLVTTIV